MGALQSVIARDGSGSGEALLRCGQCQGDVSICGVGDCIGRLLRRGLLAMTAVLAFCALVPLAHAQDAPPAAAPAQAASAADAQGPVAVPEPSEKAMQFYHSGNKWWLFGEFWDLLVPVVILFTGFSAWMRRRAEGLARWWPLTLAIYWVLLNIVVSLVELPIDYYREFVRMHAYGLSDQTLGKFVQDWVIQLLLGCGIGALLIWIPFLLLRKLPRTWWIFCSALAVPLLFLQMLIWPVYIDPLFNKFHDMTNKDLEAKILAIADRAGIEGARVYEVDKSVDTNMVNAYVTGFAGSKRIVLWDTLLKKVDDQEALFVMAHEMGHYVLNHVVYSICFAGVLLAVALYAVHALSGAILRRFGDRFGFHELSDPAALPLIMLIVSVLFIVIGPVFMAYSRMHEHEADRFALEITRDNHSGATAFVKLLQENLGNPRPDWFVKVWRGSHPTLGDRIDFCNDYHPWREGKPGMYEHLFKAQQ